MSCTLHFGLVHHPFSRRLFIRQEPYVILREPPPSSIIGPIQPPPSRSDIDDPNDVFFFEHQLVALVGGEIVEGFSKVDLAIFGWGGVGVGGGV